MVHKKIKIKNSESFFLNMSIGIAGVFLLGFIYSFSRNATQEGVPIKVTFPKSEEQPLA